jgi:hypothetical protein
MDYTALQILSRKQLVQLLTQYYQLNFLKPKLHSVPLTDGSVATVPIFNVKALLIAFLNDPLRMRQEIFASNYDIFTGKAKSPTSTLDEIDRNCDVLPLSLEDLLNYTTLRLKFCTNKPIWALLLRQVVFFGGGKWAFRPKKGCNAPSASYGFPRKKILRKLNTYCKLL